MNNENKDIIPNENAEEILNETIEENTESVVAEESTKASDESSKKASFKQFLLKIFPNKSDNKKTLLIKIVALVLAVAILVSGGYLIYYFVDVTTQDIVINNVRATYELNRDDYSYNASGEFSKFEYLKKQNNDLSGWITIPGSEVDNPIYQTSDNEFYLNHDMNKAYNRYGTLYVDYRCNLHPASLTQNQIIYGHNMRYGAMFGTLDEYRKVEYYKTHPIIKLDTLYESRTYKIFAVMITNSSVDKTFDYEFSPYRVTFTSQEDFTNWVGHCKDRSLIDTNVDVNEYDEVLTLSTCCYDFDDARLVVVARLVREGESSDVDVSNAALNPDVLYSKEYYDKKKLPIPNITKD